MSEAKELLEEKLAFCGPQFMRNLVWHSTNSIHEATKVLFNAGYRGIDLQPPPGWPFTDGTVH